jgi:hypothetical protein
MKSGLPGKLEFAEGVKKAHIDLKEEIQDGMFLHIPPT